jgi:hypothetical protein
MHSIHIRVINLLYSLIYTFRMEPVKAFGLLDGRLRVSITKEAYKHQRQLLATQINNTVKAVRPDWTFTSDELVVFCPMRQLSVKLGSKLIPENSTRFGTLSAFGIAVSGTETGCEFVITCAHVARKGSNVYTDDLRLLGVSKYATEGKDALNRRMDIAAISVSPERSLDYEKIGTEVYRGDYAALTGERIYKIGAKTGRTEGQYRGVYYTKARDEDGVDVASITYLFSGLDSELGLRPFALPGDSGSVICKYSDDGPGDILFILDAGDVNPRHKDGSLVDMATYSPDGRPLYSAVSAAACLDILEFSIGGGMRLSQ